MRTALASHTLGSNVENLTYTGAAAFSGTGNTLANTITGGAGGDTLAGGDGDDTLIGKAGADAFDRGNGSDTVSYVSAAAGLTVHMGWLAQNTGESAGDTYSSIENVEGSAFADEIIATDLANVVRAGAGNDSVTGLGGEDNLDDGDGDDSLYAGIGNDTLTGGAGADTFFANAGADRVVFGAGADFALGEAGNDTFVVAAGGGHDIVGDFSDGDLIELAGLGISSFQQLQAYMTEWNGTTYIDFDAQSSITLESVAMSSLQASDFVFA